MKKQQCGNCRYCETVQINSGYGHRDSHYCTNELSMSFEKKVAVKHTCLKFIYKARFIWPPEKKEVEYQKEDYEKLWKKLKLKAVFIKSLFGNERANSLIDLLINETEKEVRNEPKL